MPSPPLHQPLLIPATQGVTLDLSFFLEKLFLGLYSAVNSAEVGGTHRVSCQPVCTKELYAWLALHMSVHGDSNIDRFSFTGEDGTELKLTNQ